MISYSLNVVYKLSFPVASVAPTKEKKYEKMKIKKIQRNLKGRKKAIRKEKKIEKKIFQSQFFLDPNFFR